MAISGTYAAGDYASTRGWKVGLDIAASGTYVDVSTWVLSVRFNREGRAIDELTSHGGITETLTGTLPNVPVEIDVFYDMASTGPLYNMIQLMEGASQSCNVKVTESNLTTPASGDAVYTWTSCKIYDIDEPELDQNADPERPVATLYFTGSLATSLG